MKVWYDETDTLIQNHNYKKALYQLENTQPVDKKKIKDVHKKANKFAQKELKHIQAILTKKQWSKAENLLEALLAKVPSSQAILKVQEQLNQQRHHEQLDQTIKVQVARANLLLAKQSNFEFQSRDKGNSFWNYTNNQLKTDIIHTADELLSLSKQSLNIEHLDNAQLALNYAKKLNKNLIIDDLKKTIKAKLLKRSLKIIKQKQSLYMSQLKKAINDENFEQIIHLTSTLSNPKFKGRDLNLLIEKANLIRHKNAQEMNLSADQAYRLGHIKEAIQLWQQAQTLHPQLPGISDKISRAQKVSNKLDNLRQSQGQ
ncbi:hypothetical protein NBRC116188_00270 [Oceaniserpentilla sp. 4NH20-0058]|uniref:hypothetical protein n=1 Tax=Oceaniserpentilla sp. 4NH20-0058 TaxID=3127660 RepID=UPI003104D5FC